MKSLFAFLFLLDLPLCVLSQITLVESGPGVVKPSDTLTLTCKVTGVNIGSSYYWSWIRQAPGKALEWLAAIHGTSSGSIYYAPSLQSRLTISKDNSKNEFYLQMRGMKPEDSARYYCARDRGWLGGDRGAMDIWGQGTLMTVTSGERKAPSVFPLLPCCPHIGSMSEIPIGCLVSNYLLKHVEVKFKMGSNEIHTGVKRFPATFKPAGYTSSSHLSISQRDWEINSYHCDVFSNEPKWNKTVTLKKSDCQQYQTIEPTVSVFRYPDENLERNKIKLVCLVTKFRPQEAKVQWFQNGKKELSKTEDFSPLQDKDHTFTGSIQVEVRKDVWDKGNTFSCKVTHEKWEKSPEFYNISKCSDFSKFPVPTVYLVKPSYSELFNNKKGVVSCLVVGVDLAATTISWEIDGQPVGEKEAKDPFPHPNNTQTITSTHEVSLSKWNSSTKFSCKVKHPCLAEILESITIKSPGRPVKAPVIVMSKANYAGPSQVTYITLFCEIKDFYPEDISLMWYRNGLIKEKSSHYINGPVVESNGTYSTYSILKVPKFEEVVSFVIKVQHISSTDATTDSVQNVFAFVEKTEPNVTVLQSSMEMGQVKLVCLADNYWPKDITMRWLVGNESMSCSANSTTSLSNGKYATTCDLILTLEQRQKGKTYTCCVQHESNSTPIKKDYHSSEYKAPVPESYLLSPSFEELFVNNASTLTFLTNALNATVIWMVDGKHMTQGVNNEWKEYGNGTVWLHSTLNVTLKEWKTTKILSCQLTSPLLTSPSQFNISRQHSQPKAPNIFVFPLSSEDILVNPLISLVCLVKDFYPEDIFVKWEKSGTEGNLNPSEKADVKCDHQKQQCSVTSEISVSKSDWLEGATYTCVVAHISSEKTMTKHTDKNTVYQVSGPRSYLLRPSFEELFMNKTATINFLTNVPNASVIWMVDGKPIKEGVKQERIPYSNGSIWLHSTLPVTLMEWNTTKIIHCQLNSTEITSPLQFNITRQYNNFDQLKAPSIYLFPLSSDLFTNLLISLVCLIKDFYPEDIFVKWEKNGTEAINISEKVDIKCDHQNQHCSVISELRVPKSDWLEGTTYTCVVAHISSIVELKRSSNIATDIPFPYYCDETCDSLSEIDEDGSVWMTASTFIALFLLTLLYSTFVTFLKVK